jgi:hypothetical protein
MSDALKAEIKRLEELPCACVTCSECGGTGNVWFAFGGREYLGRNRGDDLDEMETCEYCNGHGIVETCERCIEIQELEENLADEEYRVRAAESKAVRREP